MKSHDGIEHNLVSRLINSKISYNTIDSKVIYKIHHKDGECDVIGIYDKYAVVVEIKGHDKPKSRSYAKKQIKKDIEWIREVYKNVTRIFPFYAYSDTSSKKYRVEWY